MKSIFASKLYQSSSRKARIHAALIAPGNFSLVQQLADSLDEEYRTPDNLGQEESSKTKSAPEGGDFNDLILDEKIDPSKDLVTVDDMKKSMGSKPHASSKPSSEPSEPSDHEESHKESDTSNLMPDSPMTEMETAEKSEKPAAEPKSAEASTTIESSTFVTIDRTKPTIDINVIKATLNGRSDLAGVTRVAEKENELWIYYGDAVNLNDIMVDVIEFLTLAGYSYLEFNRLARSDNAIVFIINPQTLSIPNRTVQEAIEEAKK